MSEAMQARRNRIDPEIRKFAVETGAKGISPHSQSGIARVAYDDKSVVHTNSIPDGYSAVVTSGGTDPMSIDIYE